LVQDHPQHPALLIRVRCHGLNPQVFSSAQTAFSSEPRLDAQGENTISNQSTKQPPQRERPRSHEDREAQTLVKRIEKSQASQEAAREAETKRTLDDYGKKVGS
jgi:hypothetical protein